MKTAVRNILPKISRVHTTRLDVAAFLLVRGFEIANVDIENGTATFTFNDPEQKSDSVAKEFYNGAQVSASEYAAAQKRTRDLMWEARRQAS